MKIQRGRRQTGKDGVGTGPGPPNVFARDLHKPSIDYASATEEGPPVEPTARPEAPSITEATMAELEAMEINAEPPEANQGTD